MGWDKNKFQLTPHVASRLRDQPEKELPIRTVLTLAALAALAACSEPETDYTDGILGSTEPSLAPLGSDSLAAADMTSDPSTDCPGLMMTDSDLPENEIEMSDEEWDDWYRESLR